MREHMFAPIIKKFILYHQLLGVDIIFVSDRNRATHPIKNRFGRVLTDGRVGG